MSPPGPAANDAEAAQLRRRFADEHTLVTNLISSPGSARRRCWRRRAPPRGRATRRHRGRRRDRARRRAAAGGRPARLPDPDRRGLSPRRAADRQGADPGRVPRVDLLFIENVGNLICPTTYDLGEDFKVALLSVTEGSDKRSSTRRSSPARRSPSSRRSTSSRTSASTCPRSRRRSCRSTPPPRCSGLEHDGRGDRRLVRPAPGAGGAQAG